MKTTRKIGLACAALWLGCCLGASVAAGEIELTYLGNEGFLVVGGGKRVLIDALFGDGLPGYSSLPIRPRTLLEQASPPFDGVDLILVTHHHGDHFDARAVARYMKANPRAMLLTTEQTVQRMQRKVTDFDRLADRVQGLTPAAGEPVAREVAGIPVVAFSLHHGRERPTENVGYLIELGDRSVLHVGDTMSNRTDLETSRLAEYEVDFAMLPFWYYLAEEWEPIREGFGAQAWLAMHMPVRAAPPKYFDRFSSLNALTDHLDAHPAAPLWFTEPMDSKTLP